MFRGLGIDWACTLLGCIGVVLAMVPFLFYRYGKTLRARSKMAADDL
jgi:MFS transporter, DHA1 family, multidrug resistance protein